MFTLRTCVTAVLVGATVALAACSSTIVENAGGAGGASSSSSSESSASSSASSASSGSAVSTSASSGGGGCPTTCTTHADCQSACPDPGAGSTTCCNAFGCYVAPACPPPCVPGAACEIGTFCVPIWGDPDTCVESCACDDTGHYACKLFTDYPSCPAVHPDCGSPCDPSTKLYCKCTTNGGTESCTCDPGTSTWSCGSPNLCSLFDTPPKAKCTDFDVGTPCGEVCQCVARCGTQVWMCTI